MQKVISAAVSFNPGAKYIILYNRPIDVNQMSENVDYDIAFQIFTMMYKIFNAANVVLLYAINDLEYEVIDTDPYKNTADCGKFIFFRIITHFRKNIV